MTHTPAQEVGKYGEPWRRRWQTIGGEDFDDVVDRDGKDVHHLFREDRTIACVNAFAGIADPAAELARLRAIEAALPKTEDQQTAIPGVAYPCLYHYGEDDVWFESTARWVGEPHWGEFTWEVRNCEEEQCHVRVFSTIEARAAALASTGSDSK